MPRQDSILGFRLPRALLDVVRSPGLARMHSGGLGLAAAVGLTAHGAIATERHFSYTYETGVLGPGHAEIEPWTTHRYGRTDYYSRFDQRLELELGVVEGLQTALYWNFEATTEDQVDANGDTVRLSGFDFASVSSEWKFKLSDPVADTLGSALYVEGSLGPREAAIEGKLLLDKRWGPWIVAVNLVAEREWEFEAPGETEKETELEVDLAAGYLILPELSVGAEARQVNGVEAGELEASVVYAGPVFAYASDGWWATLTVLPQLVSFAETSADSRLDLEHQERLQTRILLGLHL